VERLRLYTFAQRAFSGREWSRGTRGKNLDDYSVIAEACLAETLRLAEEAAREGDAELAAKRRDLGIAVSFNMTADLAECWPGDDLPRERHHFEQGVRAAQTCIDLCEALAVNARRKSIAQWGKGMHLLSLGEIASALESFAISLRFSETFSEENGEPSSLTPDASFHVLLGNGYLGLAEAMSGTEWGLPRYEQSIAAFTQQVQTHPDRREDAEFGIAQLQYVRSKFLP
jgi:hypothetical protein